MLDGEEEMIDVEPMCERFKRYIEVDNRCILSAKFGDGKSYFLSQFIKKYSDECLFITIYPVNYQVMENREIFELIKRDILLRLLSEKVISTKNIDYTSSFKCAYYLRENFGKVFDNLIAMIPQFNFSGFDIDIGNIYKGIRKIKEGYQKWNNEVSEGEEEKASNFVNECRYQKGSINEFDIISQFIYNIISGYKKRSKKEVVLIVEDLDRIDPAHIFRILNIFSAHFDNITYGESNKYNFDKIITVCDYKNIENIYHHIYGEKTDFIGYITKFSNREPFYYSLHELLKDYILQKLLDKSLLQYKGICDALCDNILSFLDKRRGRYNLRIVKERLEKAKKTIYNFNIPLERHLVGYYINSLNTFAYLIAIIKGFGIDEVKVLNANYIGEMIQLLGVNWLLISKFFDGYCLEPVVQSAESEITIILSTERYNTRESYEGGVFKILSCEENVIKKIELIIRPRMETELKSFLFKKRNEIIEYYKNNVIL